MDCNCFNSLRDNKIVPPAGIRAIWEEYKLPICISGFAITGVILYGKFGGKKGKN